MLPNDRFEAVEKKKKKFSSTREGKIRYLKQFHWPKYFSNDVKKFCTII